jgi:hypothetical protein
VRRHLRTAIEELVDHSEADRPKADHHVEVCVDPRYRHRTDSSSAMPESRIRADVRILEQDTEQVE